MASSDAIEAPCPAFGLRACAASPIKTTRSLCAIQLSDRATIESIYVSGAVEANGTSMGVVGAFGHGCILLLFK